MRKNKIKPLKIMGIFISILILAIFLLPYIPYKYSNMNELVTPDSKFLEIDGRKIHYVKYFRDSNRNKPTLLFIHGFGGHLFNYERLIGELKDSFNICALDMIGFGLSEKSGDFSYRLEDQAQIIKQFVDKMGIRELILIGHSMGGGVALAYHNLFKEDLKALVLISPIAPGGSSLRIAYPFNRLVAYMTLNFFPLRKGIEGVYYDKSLLTELTYKRYLYPIKDKGALNGLSKMLQRGNTYSELSIYAGKVEVSTLLIWGKEDKSVPLSVSEKYLSLIRNSQLIVIENSGHLVMEEKPGEVSEAIRKFLVEQGY